MKFAERLRITEGHKSTQGKLGLYPTLYTQYPNYPPQDVITWGADAIWYMQPYDTKFKVNYGKFKPYFWKHPDCKHVIPCN